MKTRIAILILIIITAISSVGCSGKKSRHVRIGEQAVIATNCAGTENPEMLDILAKLDKNGDKEAVELIIASRQAILLKKGLIVSVRHAKIGKVQVELLSGRKVWVYYENLE